MTLNEVLPLEVSNRIGRKGIEFDVLNENLGANLAFKALLDFYKKYNPSESPLVQYLGLDTEDVRNCNIELKWQDRRGYPSTGFSMADTFTPDVVVRNKLDKIIAVMQLKGYSQTKTSVQPNGSIFQIFELKKYEKSPNIRTALINVGLINDFIKFEWLVLNKADIPTKGLSEEYSKLCCGFEKHPELDPLIPRNLRKRVLLEEIYEKAIESKTTFNISNKFNKIKKMVLTSERKFNRFIGQKEENTLTEEIIEKYLNKMQIKLQAIVNQVGKPNGIDSCAQFRYHWTKEVTLDYYKRIQGYFRYSNNNR